MDKSSLNQPVGNLLCHLAVIEQPAAGGAVRHEEFLFTEQGCPDGTLVLALKTVLPETGSLVVWNETFEKAINKKLAARLPNEQAFLDGVNARVVDLMDVFTEQMVLHPEFKGKTSIKYILPAIVPEVQRACNSGRWDGERDVE